MQQTFARLQSEVAALKAKHSAIREANAELVPATLERVFAYSPQTQLSGDAPSRRASR